MAADQNTGGAYRSSAWPSTDGAEEEAGRPVPEQARRWLTRPRLIAAAIAAVTLLAGGVVAYLPYTGDIARGVHVLGIDLGGRGRADARRVLDERLAGRAAVAVPVRVGDVNTEVTPDSVGLRVDVDATVANAVKARPNPFTALFGRHDVPPTVAVDTERLAEVLRPHAEKQSVAAVAPAIRYEGLTPVPVYPKAGMGLDPERAADALRDGWLREQPVEVPITELVPRMSKEDVDALVRDLAAPAVAAPVTVRTGDSSFELPPAAVAASLVLTAGGDGVIVPKVDPVKLRQSLAAQLKAVERVPADAKIVLRNGAPAIVPHVDGQTVNAETLATDLLAVLSQPAPRTVTAALATTPPKLTTDAAQKLGVKERVSTFTTNFVAGQSRVTNIKRMADTVRGTLVLPGEVFSINAIVGERTKAKGYVEAPAIVAGGALKNNVGGGVSQFATTTFNAMYYAGLQDVEHRPHSYWFSRYPSVIEATLFWPDLDLQFRNDSPYGVLVDTGYTNTSLTVSMWSTKRYDIQTVWGPKTNTTQPKTVYLQDPDCIATEGIPGFSQAAWRIFKQNGQEVRRQRFFWRYDAEPRFICGPPPA